MQKLDALAKITAQNIVHGLETFDRVASAMGVMRPREAAYLALRIAEQLPGEYDKPFIDALAGIIKLDSQTAPVITAQTAQMSGQNHYVAEASTIGLRPGQWPQTIMTSLGNGHCLQRVEAHLDGGYTYRQENSNLIVRVLND